MFETARQLTAADAEQWRRSRSGSHAGRGFRSQDAGATELAVKGLVGELPVHAVIPEGLDDVTLGMAAGRVEAQFKSRRIEQGSFSVGEAAAHLVALGVRHRSWLSEEPNARLALVLERPVAQLPQSGWTAVIAEVPELAAALQPVIQDRAVAAGLDPDVLLASTHLVVSTDPAEAAIGVLVERNQLAPAAARQCYLAILDRAATLADENGTRKAGDPALLTVGDTQRIYDETLAIVDLARLEAAVREGICEAVDFVTPLVDPGFYAGVDVVPGHVVAGLTVERRKELAAIEQGLADRRAVLVVGPSGSGKSALVWMAAYGTRHVVRWYRIKRLTEADVASLLRFVDAMRPTERALVGLAVDDVGQSGRAGWDVLADEVLQRPGVLLLGGVREEDLFTLSTAQRAEQVRPRLEAELARHVWEELQDAGRTMWPDWPEPFERSNGLLLEYLHLLTAGRRLAATIEAQVDRRLREARDLELRVLRLVAMPAAWGATVDVEAVRAALGASEEELQRALARLLDEHLLVQVNPGELGGLHQLRSTELLRATHGRPPPTLAATIDTVLGFIAPYWLPQLLSGILAAEVVTDEAVVDRLAVRLTVDPDPVVLGACLDALRVVSFRRLADQWLSIMDVAGVPPASREITATFALMGSDVSGLPFHPAVHIALPQLTATLEHDLRTLLLERLEPATLAAAVARADRLDVALQLLGAAADGHLSTLIDALAGLTAIAASELDLKELSRLLAAARYVDLDLARRLVDAAGGVDGLLGRADTELPWVRDVHTTTDDSGRVTVHAVWRYLGAHGQDDPHEQVVETCRILAGFAPDAKVLAVRAIDPSGVTAGYGDYEVADKQIERRHLPGSAEVAWNRQRIALVTAQLAAETRTRQLVAERALLVQAAEALSIAADAWCRGRPATELTPRFDELVRGADQLAATTVAEDATTGNSAAAGPSAGRAAELVKLLAGNALGRLIEPQEENWALAAFVASTLLPMARELLDSDYWRLISDPPREVLEGIVTDLADVHAVLAERLAGGARAQTALRKAQHRTTGNVLPGYATVARRRADERLSSIISQLRNRLRRQGFTAQIVGRPPREEKGLKGLVWPPDELAFSWKRSRRSIGLCLHRRWSSRVGGCLATSAT